MNRVKARRIELGLTQPELARRTGLSVPTISRVENGWNAPTAKNVNKLAEGLECEVWDIEPEDARDWHENDYDVLISALSDEDLAAKIRGNRTLRRVVAAFLSSEE